MKISTPLRYAGGKSRAIKQITPHIGRCITKYIPPVRRMVSPFAGSCALEIYWAHHFPTVDEIIAYDIFPILVDFWNVILTRPGDLADALMVHSPTKEHYTEMRLKLKAWWNGELTIKDKIELVALYYFNHQCSYGPMFLGWPSSVYLKKDVYLKIVERVRNFRCPKLKVRLGDFVDVLPQHRNDFLYLDPPYYHEEGKMFKALYPNCNFPIHHKGFKHDELRRLLSLHQGGYVMSYNDCDTIKRWYKDCQSVFPQWHYSFQQGETRIGKNRKNGLNGIKDNKKTSHEILLIKS